MEIKKLIDKKAQEHQKIIEQIQVDIEKIRKNVAGVQKNDSTKALIMVESAKMLALKDRLLFHKSAVLVLRDLEKDLP